MPDENTNPVWTTQASQNDQAVTNQTWDDFVLDFWEGENNEQDTESGVEIDNLVAEKEQEDNSAETDFNIDLFDDNEKTDDSEDDKSIQDENINNKESNIFNDIQGERMEETEGDTIEETERDTIEETEGDTIEGTERDTMEETEEETMEETEGERMEETEGERMEETEGETMEETEDFNISLDEDNLPGKDELSLFDKKEEDPKAINVDSNPIIDELVEDKEDQGIIDEPEKNPGNISVEDTDNHTYFWNKETETGPWEIESSGEKTINNSPNSIIDNTELVLKQPEIWDLLWESFSNFSMQEHGNDTEEIDNESTKVVQPISDETEKPNFPQREKGREFENENHSVENDKESTNISTENQSFTLDYVEPNWNEQEEVTKSKIPAIVNVETPDVTEQSHTNADINQTEKINQVENQQISTLSLDQILDTELVNNPQLTDNSTAVPVNMPRNKWLFGSKKTIWVVTWIGMMLLAVFVVVLAFPSGISKEKKDSIDDEQIVEEHIGDHQVATLDESIEDNPENDAREDIWQWDTNIHSGKITVQEGFPEAEWEDGNETFEGDTGWDRWEIDPYVCDWDDCPHESWNQWNSIVIWDILPIISNYKSQAEQYYSQWDEMQDKKLVKLSLKAIYLCNSYESQINNWEDLDEESLLSFESKIEKLLDKMQDYLGGNDYEIVQNNAKKNYFE